MRKFLKLLLICAALSAVSYTAGAQGLGSIRINEILVNNVDNYMDDYGHRSSWVEMHNTSHATVDIGGCFLRATAGGKEHLYRIPTGDPRTRIEPLGYIVFYCEGTGSKGTLYTNFTLEGVESIALLGSTGKGNAIDEVAIDYTRQMPDVSIGYITRDNGEVAFGPLPSTTPNATNDTEQLMPRHEKFRRMDPHGGMMAIIAVCVVLSVLTVLFLLFKFVGNYNVKLTRKKAAASEQVAKLDGKSYDSPYSGEEVAAIAMALKMYMDQLHDKEHSVLTINKVARAYSPWSSKIYGLQQFTRNKK